MDTCRVGRGAWLALAAGLALALPARADEAKAKTARVAHISLSGGMEEKSPDEDPLLGTLGETFEQKLDRIRKAGKDKEVQALYLEVKGLGVGWGKLDELTRAIADFRKTGKKVFAYVETGATRDYLVGLACDDLAMPETGWLMLTGIQLEASFYKDLLDKIGVKADFLHMKEYKGAAEPFTRNSLSEPNRRQLEALVDDFYEKGMVGRIVESRPARKLTADKVKKLIDGGPYSAREAVKLGLVDRLAHPDTYKAEMKKVLDVDAVKVVRDYAKKTEEVDIFSLYRKLIFGPGKLFSSGAPKVAVIYAAGPIVVGKGGSGLLSGEVCGSDTMLKAIREAEADKTVKAIVLRVDSPGGSAVASDLIYQALKDCKKPVVASMSDVAASGGYYISMGARRIYAEPNTITGSIGVVGGKFVTAGLWDKVGIKTEVIKRGANAGIFSAESMFSPAEKARFKALMVDVYEQFVDKAHQAHKRAGKKMTRDELEKMARGRIWTGRAAQENGLIDELGTLEDAIAGSWKMAGQKADKEPELLYLPKSKGIFDQLLDRSDARLGGLERRLLGSVPGLAEKLRPAGALLHMRTEPVLAILPFHLEVK